MNEATTAIITRLRSTKDFYDVLGVEREATEDEIKKSYRKLAMKLHPDKCQLDGCEEAFKKVSSAYACLSDSEKRQQYNLTGSEDGPSGMGGFRGGQMDPNDIFQAFFSGGQPGMGGGTRGGQSFHFSTNMGGGGGGGADPFANVFEAFAAQQRTQQTREDNDDADPRIGRGGGGGGSMFSGLASFWPLLLVLVPLLMIALQSVVSFFFKRSFFLIPIMVFAPSGMKGRLLLASFVLNFLGFF
jgi:hypothetical protein